MDGTICLASEMNLQPPVEEVNNSFGLNKSKNFRVTTSMKPDITSSNSFDQSQFILGPAAEQFFVHRYSDFDIEKHHVIPKGTVVREIIFQYDGKMYYVKIENQISGSLNEFSYDVLEFNQTLKQSIELRLHRSRLFYSKRGVFGFNYSSEYQFEPEVIKLAPVTYPPVAKLNPTFTPYSTRQYLWVNGVHLPRKMVNFAGVATDL
jgi:hypothetical protein